MRPGRVSSVSVIRMSAYRSMTLYQPETEPISGPSESHSPLTVQSYTSKKPP